VSGGFNACPIEIDKMTAVFSTNYELRTMNFRTGFTLTEALLSTVIFCGAATVIMAVSARCMDRTRENRCYEIAWQLLDRQLTAVSYVGIDEYKKQGIMQGTFKGTDPEYNWAIQATASTVSSVDDVQIVVSWSEKSKQHAVSLMTRMRSVLPSDTEIQEPNTAVPPVAAPPSS
jgi:Tfp pilus assembly protein PilV